MDARDLDTLCGEPIPVTLFGREYLFPGSVPHPQGQRVDYLLGRLRALAGAHEPDEDLGRELFDELYAEILALGRLLCPDLDELPLTGPQIYGFFDLVYGHLRLEAPS